MACPDYLIACHPYRSTQRRLTQPERAAVTGHAADVVSQAELCSSCGLVFLRGRPSRRLGWLDYMATPGFRAASEFACLTD
jgi:hypothetical protein